MFSFSVPFLGSAASPPSTCAPNVVDRGFPDGTCLAFAATPDGGGYWILNVDKGTITAFGNAGDFGEPADDFVGVPRELVPTGKAIVSTPTGMGYWVLEVGLSGAGSVLPFGDADFFGDTVAILQQTGVEFHGEPVGLVATPTRSGLLGGLLGRRRLRLRRRGLLRFDGWHPLEQADRRHGGDAERERLLAGRIGRRRVRVRRRGLLRIDGRHPLEQADRRHGSDAAGTGYWLVATDGGVFAFGAAPFVGSMGGTPLARPIAGIAGVG